MDKNIKLNKDFDFVLKVLESAKNKEHLDVCVRLSNNFKKKWNINLNNFYLKDYIVIFEKELKKKYDYFNNF